MMMRGTVLGFGSTTDMCLRSGPLANTCCMNVSARMLIFVTNRFASPRVLADVRPRLGHFANGRRRRQDQSRCAAGPACNRGGDPVEDDAKRNLARGAIVSWPQTRSPVFLTALPRSALSELAPGNPPDTAGAVKALCPATRR